MHMPCAMFSSAVSNRRLVASSFRVADRILYWRVAPAVIARAMPNVMNSAMP